MKTITYYIVFVLLYCGLSVGTAMFFVSWGAKRNIIERLYVVFIGSPFDWSESLWLVPLNGICWATLFLLLKIIYQKVFYKKH